MEDKFTEEQLEKEMQSVYNNIKKEIPKYNPNYFLKILNDNGALKAARKLLSDEKPSEGFITLTLNERLDLSLEHLIVHTPQFHHFFTEEMLKNAKRKLGL